LVLMVTQMVQMLGKTLLVMILLLAQMTSLSMME